MENTTQRLPPSHAPPPTSLEQRTLLSPLFPPDEDDLVCDMFPAVMASSEQEKIRTRSHILAENKAGKVGQNDNPQSAQKVEYKAG